MKTMIVFLGLLWVGVSVTVYQGDMGRYLHTQTLLKATAEECAAGAALFFKEERFAEGAFVFDEEAGQEYADGLLWHTMARMKNPQAKAYSCHLLYEGPSVTALVRVKTEDLFRLPFFSVTHLERESRYELKTR